MKEEREPLCSISEIIGDEEVNQTSSRQDGEEVYMKTTRKANQSIFVDYPL